MDLKFSPEEEKCRDEVRAYIDAALPADIRAKIELGRRSAAYRRRRTGVGMRIDAERVLPEDAMAGH